MNPALVPNFVELLIQRAIIHPERVALHCVSDAATTVHRYADLDQSARAVAARLQASAAPGERAIILLPSGADYVAAFFGCLYAGLIAVPAYPPESTRAQHLNRLFSIVEDAQPRVILTHTTLLDSLRAALAGFGTPPELIAVDAIPASMAADWREFRPPADAIAFLQYTSGSTATPKGVMVGHANLMANEQAIKRRFAIEDDDKFVSWLPLYHDMGLVGGLLQPLYSGIAVALMSPRYFLERPVRWLEVVSRFGGTISGGPDFAFRLCAERIAETRLAEIDLRTWRLAFCGAEPIRPVTLDAFATKFAPVGLDRQALYPCYGLAESTLLVTGGQPGTGAASVCFDTAELAQHQALPATEGVSLVDCGWAQEGHELVTVDPDTQRPTAPGVIGEIWLSGPSVAQGYWQKPQATADTFVTRDGQTWLRTGDLGVLDGRRLFVTGRLKDMILIRGQNLYPQDIEQVVEEQVDVIRKGRVAAFAVDLEGREAIGIAAEISRTTRKLVTTEALFEAIDTAVAEAFQEPVGVILLLEPGALPKTTSGKLQRSACRTGWRDGSLDSYAVGVNRLEAGGWRLEKGGLDLQPQASGLKPQASDLETQIAALWRDVLGVPVVNSAHSFFALGGNSLTAMAMLVRLGETLALPLEPRVLFEAPTLREFAARVEQARPLAPLQKSPIAPISGTDRLALAAGQESLWHLAHWAPESKAYHIVGGLRLTGALDRAALQQAFNALAERHEILRTTFHAEDGKPYQRIQPPRPVAVDYFDRSQVGANSFAPSPSLQPFDLERGPLWRITLTRHAAQDHTLWLVLHHLIADGTSITRLLTEVGELYAAACAKREAQLPALPIRYADYAAWQRAELSAGTMASQLAYWQSQLGDEHPILELPGDHPRPALPSHRGGQVIFHLEPALSTGLASLAQSENATLFMALLTGFAALLYRYTGQREVRVGVPVALRQRPEVRDVVGYFVNMLVFRTAQDSRLNFRELLAQVKTTALAAQDHSEIPFERVVDALQPERGSSHHPLFQVAYNHQTLDFRDLEQRTGWQVERLIADHGAAQFDLSLDTEQDGAGRITGIFTYAADLFERDRVERLAAHFLTLLRAWVRQPEQPLGAVPLLSDGEQAQLVAANTWARIWDTRPIHDLIRQQAEARPDALALVAGADRLSYGELEQRANRLAHRLIDLGAGRETVVGLMLDRSAAMLIAMLGTLKAGAAFLPLDPELPAERLTTLLNNMGACLIVARPGTALPAGFPVCWYDEANTGAPLPSPAVAIHPEQLAYLIHTSGSTGTPKAVAVTHGALSRHIQAAGALYGMGHDDCALHFAAFGFDAAVEQWAAPLTHGAGLVLGYPDWTGEDTAAVIERERITVIYPPTPHLLHVADVAENRPLRLRICTVGGEAVARDSVDRIRRALRPERLINGYGPTETVVTPLAWVAGPDTLCPTAYAPLGEPVGERTAWVLDGDLNPLPVGVPGELYIGGPCLARGYANQPGLTAERFIPDPFGTGRLYRTGDIVRRHADSTLEFLGRNDQQIKLRGHRIEPGEIEAVLLRQPSVREAVVLMREDEGRKYLAAYVATDVEADTLKAALTAYLPDYLVPAHIVRVDTLPRTRHGKVDRNALPRPESATNAERLAPRTDHERQLQTLWRELLGRDDIGVTDNFFELGGDSILAIQAVSRARRLGFGFTPKDIFRHHTIENLARIIDTAAPSVIDQAPVTGPVPLTPIQSEFFALDIPNRQHWNQALLLVPRVALDLERLDTALRHLVNHHDALRLRFRLEENRLEAGGKQAGGRRLEGKDPSLLQYHADSEAAVSQDLLWIRTADTPEALATIAQEAQRSLNLEHGPLLRAVHITLPGGEARLLLVIHHLVVDGVSWRILLEDLGNSLRPQASDPQPPASSLQPKTSSFQTWAERLAAYAQHADLRAELDGWETRLQRYAVAPTPDMPQGSNRARDRVTLNLSLDREASRRLDLAAAAQRAGIQECLLAALARALCQHAALADIGIELESHGREDLFPDVDLTRTVGWFTAVYPLRVTPGPDALAALRSVSAALHEVPNHGIGYGLLKHLAPADLRARIAALPRPAVTFNYLGRLEASFDPETSLFLLASESTGLERDPDAPLGNELEINAQHYGGELVLTWSYSRERYREATMHTLLDRFRDELEALIAVSHDHPCRAVPADFPLSGLDQAQLDALNLPWSEIEAIYPLSPMRQGILFHTLQLGADDPYFYQRVFLLEGELDAARFAAAWQSVIARHSALRSAYRWEDHPLHIVYQQRPGQVPEQDWRALAPAEQWQRLTETLREERQRGFDFAGEREVGLGLFRVADSRYWLLWSHHHIALDGWSMGLVLRDLLRAYRGELDGTPYADADAVRWLASRDHAAALDYWRGQLAGWSEPTPLPLAATNPDASGYKEVSFSLDAATTTQLRTAARRLGVTVNTLLQAAHAWLLGRHADSAEVVFGVTVSGRSADLAGMEERVGLFINTLPLRVRLDSASFAGPSLREVQARMAENLRYEFTPLADIQRLGDEGLPLFESILVFENYPLDKALHAQDGPLRFDLLDRHAPPGILNHGRGRNNYPLSLIAHLDATLDLTYSGQKRRFQAGAMAELAGQLRFLLEQLAAQPEPRLHSLRLEPEVGANLFAAGDRDGANKFAPTLLEAWQTHVLRQPETLAVSDARHQLSYAALDALANRIAYRLRGLGVGPETPVGVYLERSVELVAALLGIFKAGGVYVPLDTGLPAVRLGALVADAGIRVVLGTQEPVWLRDSDAVFLDIHGTDIATHDPITTPYQPEQAAYLIYTSGSTGQPKGVVISHAALDHYLHGVSHRLDPLPEGALAMVSTPAADLGHTVLFGALYTGRPLYLMPPEAVADADRFAAAMAGQRIATLKIVPGLLRGLLQAARPAEVLPEDLLILGGEACPPELVETVRQLKPGCRIVNHYGPTETTVGVLTHTLDPGESFTRVPLGQPLPGVSAYVLDRDLNPMPEGVPGELYIGGASVARGYLGQPGATAERFIPNPFFRLEAGGRRLEENRLEAGGRRLEECGSEHRPVPLSSSSLKPQAASLRLYRTGDRVVCRHGRIEFLGRVDTQVKIRGYRVEPEEVARVLLSLDGVRDALVIADTPDNDANRRRLLGYVVLDADTEQTALMAELARRLPDYLVPAQLIALQCIPRTANGKPAYKQLPAPEVPARAYLAPRTATEQALAAIWQTVLQVERVGASDHFLELGGDSILSLQVIARARKQGLKLTPRLVFDHPVLADLAECVAGVASLRKSGIPRATWPDHPPLSYGQERLWFLAQLQPESAAYHIAGGLRLTGDVDVDALRGAFERLAERHEMLRTTFHAEDGQPFQRVHAVLPVSFRYLDRVGANLFAAGSRDEANEFAPTSGFDLEHGPLWRITLVRVGEQKYQLWLALHHLIADGWSLNRLMAELAELYAAAREHREASLPALPIRYLDYAVWQRDWLKAGEMDRQLAYWQARLGDEHPVLELPGEPSRTTGSPAAQRHFQLAPSLGDRLKHLAQAEGASVFMVLLTAFAALLYRHSGQRNLRVGIPVANRDWLETENVVGFFVNTLVIAADIDGRLSFRELVARTRDSVLGAQAHADLPFEQLVDALRPERSLHHTPLFQVMYNHQKRDLSALKKLPGVHIERIAQDGGTAQFDVSLATEEDESGTITGQWVYAAERFQPDYIARLERHFLALLTAWVANPERPLGAIPLLDASEQAQLAAWNATARDYPAPMPIHERIRRHAERHPDAPALIFGEHTLSYGELEQRANRLAQHLLRHGVTADRPVGICMYRSLEMVVGLLAILKAGGAYVPLDPEYPAERLAYMLDDSGIGLLLSHRLVGERLPMACPVLDLDTLDLAAEPDTAPQVPLHPEHLAYIIYTSGSTGRPKGAGNTHAALLNRLDWMQEAYRLGPDDTVLQKTPFGFDVSVWEFFWPLMVGARLAIAPPGAHRDPSLLAELIRVHQVTTLHFVPSMLHEFIAHDDDGAYPSLRRIVCSGEALSVELRNRVFQRLPGVALHNLYGPTEAAIDVTHWTCAPSDGATVPIGHPIANLAIHILDPDLNPVPVGVAGELYIGGTGLARGYHCRPGLTAERFIPNPFFRLEENRLEAGGWRLEECGAEHPPLSFSSSSLKPQASSLTLYRTGDRARRRPDGAIEYLGRCDHQVKLRGFRIELGEIEAQLLAQSGVREAVVLMTEAPGGPRLVAYVAADTAQDFAEPLRRELPDYMVPTRIVVLDRLPKNAHGKLDRKSLPPLEWARREYTPPHTPTEQHLAAIWCELLGVERVGLADNFFELGGHSLLAVRMVARVRAELGVSVPLAEVFATADLQPFAASIDRAKPQNFSGETLAQLGALLDELEALP